MTEDALQRWSKATLIGEITNRQGFLVSGLQAGFHEGNKQYADNSCANEGGKALMPRETALRIENRPAADYACR